MWAVALQGLGSCTEGKGDGKLRTTIHRSLLPDCECNVAICRSDHCSVAPVLMAHTLKLGAKTHSFLSKFLLLGIFFHSSQKLMFLPSKFS